MNEKINNIKVNDKENITNKIKTTQKQPNNDDIRQTKTIADKISHKKFYPKLIQYTEISAKNKIYPNYATYKTSKIKRLIRLFIFTKQRANFSKNWINENRSSLPIKNKYSCEKCKNDISRSCFPTHNAELAYYDYYSNKKRGIKMICENCYDLTVNQPNKWIVENEKNFWCDNGCKFYEYENENKTAIKNGYQWKSFCESCFASNNPKQYQTLLKRQKLKYCFWCIKHWIIRKCKIVLAFFRLYNPWKEKKTEDFIFKNFNKCHLCHRESKPYYFNHLKSNSPLIICFSCRYKENNARLTQLIGITSFLVGLMVLVVTIIELI